MRAYVYLILWSLRYAMVIFTQPVHIKNVIRLDPFPRQTSKYILYLYTHSRTIRSTSWQEKCSKLEENGL